MHIIENFGRDKALEDGRFRWDGNSTLREEGSSKLAPLLLGQTGTGQKLLRVAVSGLRPRAEVLVGMGIGEQYTECLAESTAGHLLADAALV